MFIPTTAQKPHKQPELEQKIQAMERSYFDPCGALIFRMYKHYPHP